MEKLKLSIGETIEVKEEHELKDPDTGEIMLVRKGDRGFVDSEGHIVYICGEAEGVRVKANDIEAEGFHINNISLKILDDLNDEINLLHLIEDSNISMELILMSIRKSIADILIN